MEDEQTTYLLSVVPEPGVDGIRALRAWLKIGLRTFGLKVLKITPSEKETAMDMRKYASTYIKPDNVRDGPLQTRIVNVYQSAQFGRPVLELETGSQFTLNEGNINILMKAWGYDSKDWIGQEVELLLGSYKDWRADPPADKETVKVRAISPAKAATGNSGSESKPLPPAIHTPAPAVPVDLDDEIPFVLAFFIVSAVIWLVVGGSTLIA